MNYGKQLLYILLAGAGMTIICIGISYKTGYFPGHSATSAHACMALGIATTLLGLVKMFKN